ncbi:EF-hand domain-containing protein [Sphingomonas alba]|uniref:Histidine kinase n=1 Tax=Sphingomonas alba TaxID=2908208 RepID=A0ABT0RIT0_9SPHN|nr:histidine kinase [Sphingomonas alba]
MARTLAAIVSGLFLIIGAVLLWQGRPEKAEAVTLPPPPQADQSRAPLVSAPEATPKSREERRFSRADKDKNGKISAEELYGPRRKAFAKLDTNGNGSLSFEEWAAKTIDKFEGADKDKSGWLTAAEYATTAPPPPKKKPRCGC